VGHGLSWLPVFGRFLGLFLLPLRYPEILVLEMGVDRPGDMEYLLEFIPVRIGVATQVSSSHIAYFESITNIAKEKGKLIARLPEDGFAILNADDKRTLKMQEKTEAKVITYGFHARGYRTSGSPSFSSRGEAD
jgi:UDP-N-acetylmuramoyl-tripeptide--D-alanyl-D-alanine ligase